MIIFAFYSITIYLSTFGASGCLPTDIAAWIPIIAGGILGMVLLRRANQ